MLTEMFIKLTKPLPKASAAAKNKSAPALKSKPRKKAPTIIESNLLKDLDINEKIDKTDDSASYSDSTLNSLSDLRNEILGDIDKLKVKVNLVSSIQNLIIC